MTDLYLEDKQGLDQGMNVISGDKRLYFNCYDEWCGSTETGFGAEVTATLNIEQVKELYKYLGEWLAKNSA